MNFYKHWLGDYARDTADLSLMEHGAYRVMLDHYYTCRGDMPADLMKLERVCKARSSVERGAVQEIANRFFPINGDGRRHNKRADEEIERYKGQAMANQIIAEQRERKRKDARTKHDHDNEGITIRATNDAPAIARSQKKITTSTPNGVEGRVTAPDCPLQSLIDLYHDVLPMCTRMEKNTPARLQVIRARWREEAKPREKHRGYSTAEDGLAYWRRFFAWVSDSKFLTGKEPGRDGKPPFVASLPWLVKSENFAKCIEGNYHR